MLVTEPRGDFAPLNNRIMESVSAKAVLAAVDLSLFDRLSGRTLGAAELALEMGLVAERLEPFLDIMVALGLLEKTGGRYGNTGLADEFMVSDAPLYQGDYLALTMGFALSIEQSIVALLSGGEVDRAGTDKGWSTDKIMDGTAQGALWGGVGAVADAVAGLPGFDRFRSMCDIGGNHGLYTLGVLERNQAMRGTIFDLPPVAEQAGLRCGRMGFGDRVDIRGMDFRVESLPEECFDLAVTSHVLYAFREDLVGALRKIARGLKPGGWFVSHHYCGRCEPGGELYKASLELLTRLGGYSSHFIDREELCLALEEAGFEEPQFRNVPGRDMSLIGLARRRE